MDPPAGSKLIDHPESARTIPKLSHVYWMGGSPCSGKSSMAGLLAERHNLLAYHCDDHYTEHLERADPRLHPAIWWVRDKTWNEIWSRTIDKAVRDEFDFYRQEFGMILEDLRALPADRAIIAEGASLLPECVAHLVDAPRHAIWVIPSPAFQLHHYSRRPWIEGILSECDDPKAAFDTWMGRDVEFARQVASGARARGLEVVVVDGSESIEQVASHVAAHFDLPGDR